MGKTMEKVKAWLAWFLDKKADMAKIELEMKLGFIGEKKR